MQQKPLLIDTHCHLDFPDFEADREEVLCRAGEAGVGYMVNIGSSLAGSRRSIELAGRHEQVYATVGIHPHEADGIKPDDISQIRELARSAKVVAIGEIGLDYFKNYSNPRNQRPLFAGLCGVAKELKLPLVIHNRQAESDTLSILREHLPQRVVVHCFSGDEAFLEACLGLGYFISFTCNITYKKAQDLRRLVGLVPLERLFLETDAPFLPPEGLRGQRNEPASVARLAEEIAGIKGLSPEEIAGATTKNAKEFFGLP